MEDKWVKSIVGCVVAILFVLGASSCKRATEFFSTQAESEHSFSTENDNEQSSGLREGDVVFQISQSNQSPFVISATGTEWSHCGIIVDKDRRKYVLEASNTVRLTPYSQWVAKGKDGVVKVCRYTAKPVKIDYSKYLGKQYDLQFSFDNDKWYCSELVYDIYKTQLGIEICKPRPVSSYNTRGLDIVMEKREIKESQMVVAPSDLCDKGKVISEGSGIGGLVKIKKSLGRFLKHNR